MDSVRLRRMTGKLEKREVRKGQATVPLGPVPRHNAQQNEPLHRAVRRWLVLMALPGVSNVTRSAPKSCNRCELGQLMQSEGDGKFVGILFSPSTRPD